jgi:hypothetical protein
MEKYQAFKGLEEQSTSITCLPLDLVWAEDYVLLAQNPED